MFHQFSDLQLIQYCSFDFFTAQIRKCTADIMKAWSGFIESFTNCIMMPSLTWRGSRRNFPGWINGTLKHPGTNGLLQPFFDPSMFFLQLFCPTYIKSMNISCIHIVAPRNKWPSWSPHTIPTDDWWGLSIFLSRQNGKNWIPFLDSAQQINLHPDNKISVGLCYLCKLMVMVKLLKHQ